jgi:hypothetical protein
MKPSKKLSKTDFLEILTILRKYKKSLNDIYRCGIDIINYTDDYYKIQTILFEHIYGKENYDLIIDWVYESWTGEIFDKEGKLIVHIKTDEDLWLYLEESE